MAADDSSTTTTGRTPFLASDVARNQTALVAAIAPTIVGFFVYDAVRPLRFTLGTVALTSFGFWIFYSLAYLVLTQLTFGRATSAELTTWLRRTTPVRRRERIESSLSGGGPSANAHWSILAMVSVAVVWLTPGLLDSVPANVLAFTVVGTSWVVTVYSYAVHYARVNSVALNIQFPGDRPPVFMDYFYLSAQVATTFSSSDVTILTTLGRKVVTGQTIIAFVYSTFVIAMLLSVIFLTD
ncbi:hypothetical protein LLS1_14700 [Leifsonia sp. LS1]|uniref:DUF1345 domain-containing protein n=1 Tax=Leifsonia sp. LS1 TaxID=2828483 RepID=UPI001CFEF55E|nr:DUF1345 domain-containing protein [Leifsonia sp. LS1]GIT79801.1 hypothetical protein LLS1_14700 [Leifsonia sp. LS1]